MNWPALFNLIKFVVAFFEQAHAGGLLDETQGFHPDHPKTQAVLDHVAGLGSNAQPKG